MKWRFWTFFYMFIITVILCFNRFSFVIKDNVKFDFFFRNFLEHIAYGFMLPILTVILFLGIATFLRTKINSWKIGYAAGIFIFIIVGIYYYSIRIYGNTFGLIDIYKIVLDFVSFIFGSWYIISGRTKENNARDKKVPKKEGDFLYRWFTRKKK